MLFDHDDPAVLQRVRKLTLHDLGLAPDERGAAGASGRPISTLAYTTVPQAETERPSDLWTPKQLTYGGLAQKAAMEPVLAKAYDLVLNLYPAPFPPFDYLCAQVQAHLRIAGHDGVTDAYDVMINAGERGAKTWPESLLRAVADYLRAQNPHVHV